MRQLCSIYLIGLFLLCMLPGKEAEEAIAVKETDSNTILNVPDRVFSLQELSMYNGSDPQLPIYLALKGVVFDVTAGAAKFYGPGQTYNKFAGRDITRCTAMFSTEDDDLDRTDYPPAKQNYLDRTFKNTYLKKYTIVGSIINDTPAREEAEPEHQTFQGTGSSTWRGVVDADSKKTYYWNPSTGETTWSKPAGFDKTWWSDLYQVLDDTYFWALSAIGWSSEKEAHAKAEEL